MILTSFYLIFNRKVTWGIILIIFSILPIFLFFRNENLLISFWYLRKQNFQKTQKWLKNIKNINKQLYKQQHGYYYYLNGICEAQNNGNKSEYFMKKALSLGLTFDHDKALAYLNLAANALSKGKKIEFLKYITKTKKYDTYSMLTSEIKMIKEQSKKINIGKNLHNPYIRLKK